MRTWLSQNSRLNRRSQRLSLRSTREAAQQQPCNDLASVIVVAVWLICQLKHSTTRRACLFVPVTEDNSEGPSFPYLDPARNPRLCGNNLLFLGNRLRQALLQTMSLFSSLSEVSCHPFCILATKVKAISRCTVGLIHASLLITVTLLYCHLPTDIGSERVVDCKPNRSKCSSKGFAGQEC